MAYRELAEVESDPPDNLSTALSDAERAAAEAEKAARLAKVGLFLAILGAVLQLIAMAGKYGWF